MARKPNYSIERSQRARNKAEKKAERVEAKARKSAERKAGTNESGDGEDPA